MDIFSPSSHENPSSSSAATFTTSDSDFDDVFGGPPRRSSSIHEMRYSSGYIDSSPSRMSASIEKGVFGDQSLNRDDFFHDIFRGDEYCRSRRISVRVRDQVCSDHFATPITAAQFSLGANLNKSLDLHSRFSSQSVKVGGSFLSKSARTESGRNLEEDTKSPEAPILVNSRRIPLVTPIRRTNSKESIKFQRRSSSNNGKLENGANKNLPEVAEDRRKELTTSKNAKKVDVEKDFSSKPEIKGNVKEFSKIFNAEASLKCLSDVISESLNKSIIDIKIGDISFKADENVEEPLLDSTMEDPIQVEFLIDELPNGGFRLLKTDDHHEAIQVSDAKIRQWSDGKQGNIRSLLSTLQYVLWEESGWKAVALVDIIEASSVKKAYQKALLCLHPDKLQQKGAASHKKYIAQVVFDTLQEAWDHFNSIAPL